MGQIEPVGVDGRVSLVLRDREGRVVRELHAKNLVTLAGRRALSDCLLGLARPTGRLRMAVGTSERPAAYADTALGAQVADAAAEVGASVVRLDGGVQRVFTPVHATFEAEDGAGTQALREAGIWMELQDGAPVLFNRVVFPEINRVAGLELTLSWEILF